MEIWDAAWTVGIEVAEQVTGQQQPVKTWQQALRGMLAGMAATWAAQIALTTVKILAKILALSATFSRGKLLAELRAALRNLERAESIAQTEITRAMIEAAAWFYRAAGIHMVIWEIEPGACPVCTENHDAGPHMLGVPFPSGALWPPEHVRCRCALVPA